MFIFTVFTWTHLKWQKKKSFKLTDGERKEWAKKVNVLSHLTRMSSL